MIKRQTQTALEKRFILLIKFSYRKGDCRMLILTKYIVMIVIKIIINIQNKRKMAKVKTLFFQIIKITMQYYTKHCQTKHNSNKKKCQKKILLHDIEIFSKQKNPF